ncbi:glycosyltransferase family 4 protein [Roseivirga sp. BDSF3-8]|uniref:glycosyltransferase family 4 protein n=1 Tax=Roseivirga sp. BDSF3-8 TaxID=3241598 RepID=UPI003532529B
MRIAFHYHSVAIEVNGRIKTPSYIGLFIDSLASEVEEVICFMHSPRPFEMAEADYTLTSPNVRLINLGVHSALPLRIINVPRYKKIVKSYESYFDVMLIRTPSPLTFALSGAHSRPVAYYVVGDYVEGAKTLTLPTWKSTIIKGYAHYFNSRLLRAIKNRTMVANSQLLYDQLKDRAKQAYLIKSTTLSRDDIFVREDSFEAQESEGPVKILFTGRITPSKGLEDIIQACGTLIRRDGFNFEFHIAGILDKNGQQFIDLLVEKSSEFKEGGFVIFHGKLSVGEELNSLYRKCHLFTLASRGNFEGFPRVIWEAMANSLPVLATEVGSIPYFLQNEKHALLVPPNQPSLFAEAIKELVNNGEKRRKLIENGRELAQYNTLENRAKEMVDVLKAVLNQETT